MKRDARTLDHTTLQEFRLGLESCQAHGGGAQPAQGRREAGDPHRGATARDAEESPTHSVILPCSKCRLPLGLLSNNDSALIDYGTRYWAGRPISSSRAEGSVAEIVNARMARRQRMRWSSRDAHCVATVRAAVLDDRLHDLTKMRFAA